ncbi:hypothetical protein C0580_01455 [Candidatus Parcubacteria bacterium]|nr:MAG: hypothetical protein C0580_01455 [Candidatus Parcubacteria bacterium]
MHERQLLGDVGLDETVIESDELLPVGSRHVDVNEGEFVEHLLDALINRKRTSGRVGIRSTVFVIIARFFTSFELLFSASRQLLRLETNFLLLVVEALDLGPEDENSRQGNPVESSIHEEPAGLHLGLESIDFQLITTAIWQLEILFTKTLGPNVAETNQPVLAVTNHIFHEVEKPPTPEGNHQHSKQSNATGDQRNAGNSNFGARNVQNQQVPQRKSKKGKTDDARPVVVALLTLTNLDLLGGVLVQLSRALGVDRAVDLGRSHIPRPRSLENQKSEKEQNRHTTEELAPGESPGRTVRRTRPRKVGKVLEGEVEHHERNAAQDTEVTLSALLLFVDHRQQHRADNDQDDVQRVAPGPIENSVEHVSSSFETFRVSTWLRGCV